MLVHLTNRWMTVVIAIDASVLFALVPRQSGARAARQAAIIDGMAETFSVTLAQHAIETPLRIAHFLAQTAHESDGFCTTEEYADGRAYEGRRDLGNVEPGDGPRYKGRGLIQLTGRMNYAVTGAALDLPLLDKPLTVNDPAAYLSVACAFWSRRRINAACDADDLMTVTRLVNGGLNGLDSRRAYLSRAKTLLAPLAAKTVPSAADQPTLCRGAMGEAVALLQKGLAAHRYPVAQDGDFGPGTEVALRHFQAASGLAADGIAGAASWGLLG
jgi:putative chitinase